MPSKKIHVVPYGDSWAIKREGADRASKITDTKNEAIEVAREMAWRSNAEVIVHDKKGKITKGKRYGKNPRNHRPRPRYAGPRGAVELPLRLARHAVVELRRSRHIGRRGSVDVLESMVPYGAVFPPVQVNIQFQVLVRTNLPLGRIGCVGVELTQPFFHLTFPFE